MKRILVWLAAGTLALAASAFPKPTADRGQGHAIVTVLSRQSGKAPEPIFQKDLKVKISGRESSVTGWVPLREPDSNLEMVILIDGSARANLGLQLGDIASFIRALPDQAKVAVGYMDAGRAVMEGPLSTDHAKAADQLRLPGGAVGSSGSPYFCLSDLAKKWPSKDASARREVVLITDGVDNYYPQFSTLDPYVDAAINDAVRARLVVFSIYWRNRGGENNSKSFSGQSQLARLSEATGGISYWQGAGEPVSFRQYFDDIALRIQNQYRLSIQSQLYGKNEVQSLSVKAMDPDVSICAPGRVFVNNSSED